jgi:uncharacterized protein
VLWWFLFGRSRALDPALYLPEPEARQARYRRWLLRAWCLFGLPPVLTAAVLGLLRPAALLGMPRVFLPVTAALGGFTRIGDLLEGVLIGCVAGSGLLALMFLIQRLRRRGPPGTIGNVAALMPRTRGELPYGVLLAISAGITEEAFFRFSLPLLIVRAGAGIWPGVVTATLLFGAVHRYQGRWGMAATAAVGAVFAGVYAAAGALWLAMLAHALMDLVALVLRPILGGALKRR